MTFSPHTRRAHHSGKRMRLLQLRPSGVMFAAPAPETMQARTLECVPCQLPVITYEAHGTCKKCGCLLSDSTPASTAMDSPDMHPRRLPVAP